MLLRNVSVIGEEDFKNILIEKDMIKSVTKSATALDSVIEKSSINFTDAIAFPGLINSHDHLDFNLFPSLKNGTYNNYRKWGNDIHKNNRHQIDKVLQIPKELRVRWGIYKNLLNGFTTVVNHGEDLQTDYDLIGIFQNTQSLHSVAFEKRWKWKINNPLKKNLPITVHVGEGIDENAHQEIDEIIKWNLLRKKIIGIHGVAMDTEQAKHFQALVWCADSNYFLLNKTAQINLLKNKTEIIFGSDSTLTSNWNIWEHIRLARNQKMLTDKELFDSLTTKPAEVWNLRNTGKIANAMRADIVVAKRNKKKNNYSAFFAINPEDILLVIHKGNIRLFDAELKHQIQSKVFEPRNMSKIKLNESTKYIEGNLSDLIHEIKIFYPEANLPISNY